MTLADLIRKATQAGNRFNTMEIPLYDEEYVQITDIDFNVEEDEENGGYIIQMTKK